MHMPDQEYEIIKKILNEYRKRVRSEPNEDHSNYIIKQIEQADSEEAIISLRIYLGGEYNRIGQYEKAESLINEDINNNPDNPYPIISLAEHFHYSVVDHDKAKIYIRKAINSARKINEFLYLALGIQARLAIETEDWPLLENTLIQLTEYNHTPGNPDIYPEHDFITRIPTDKIRSEIIENYKSKLEFLKSVGYSINTGFLRPYKEE